MLNNFEANLINMNRRKISTCHLPNTGEMLSVGGNTFRSSANKEDASLTLILKASSESVVQRSWLERPRRCD